MNAAVLSAAPPRPAGPTRVSSVCQGRVRHTKNRVGPTGRKEVLNRTCGRFRGQSLHWLWLPVGPAALSVTEDHELRPHGRSYLLPALRAWTGESPLQRAGNASEGRIGKEFIPCPTSTPRAGSHGVNSIVTRTLCLISRQSDFRPWIGNPAHRHWPQICPGGMPLNITIFMVDSTSWQGFGGWPARQRTCHQERQPSPAGLSPSGVMVLDGRDPERGS